LFTAPSAALSSALKVPFSLGFGIFAFGNILAIGPLTWAGQVITGDPHAWASGLMLLTFGPMCFYFVVGEVLLDAWQRSRMVYGITTERVIIIFGIFRQQVNWLPLALARPTLAGERQITFSPATLYADWYRLHQRVMLPNQASREFDLGTEAQPVYDLLVSAAQQGRQEVG
jgi:hypothetical protein